MWSAREHTSGKPKNGLYIAKDLVSVVDDVGRKNIQQIVLDRSPQNQDAHPHLLAMLPGVFVTFDVCHFLENTGVMCRASLL